MGNFCAGMFYKNCFPPKKIIMVHSYWLRVKKREKKPDTMNVTTLVCYTINMGFLKELPGKGFLRRSYFLKSLPAFIPQLRELFKLRRD